ncbi:MAG TPA: imidazole glycerol phosphate synthase subunit HisH [Dehalococcoidia bacterium]|mgnify:CR=1 FL=1|jgi:glutamine amidotransferase|nr:imidazole glycerol phosphate synthase subunit HisH [Dehalococcoidia bacterium]
MSRPSIAIIDYGSGNIRSVSQAVKKVCGEPIISADYQEILQCDAAILPGVGSASQAMRELGNRNLSLTIRKFVESGKPIIGVCLGLQVLFDKSEEGNTACIGLIPGEVKEFKTDLKVPHMGWNSVNFEFDHPIFSNIPNQTHFYFVHSYYVQPSEKESIAGTTQYGETNFCSVSIQDNLIATQFHPEKSGTLGLQMYKNFIELI